ncbi:putative late blight resistance protein homolog R1A-10 isoform X2 [Sesamum indicum]|uniref:Late blight resistance protein homolog R1A-10 isoform X2 n=1 Tax=Sesamum indicum TaxID=4182 RepID=A0A8M8UTW8_SESIN|nr:putative late blight resistance protein homolog R1A-10 isoform X2 [Sesamum indicum]
MAFAALISLRYTMKKFVQSDFEQAYEEGLMSILELLNTAGQAYRSYDSQILKDVGRQMREVICRLEALFEESVIDFWEDKDEKEEINSYAQNLKEIKEELSTHPFWPQQLQDLPIAQTIARGIRRGLCSMDCFGVIHRNVVMRWRKGQSRTTTTNLLIPGFIQVAYKEVKSLHELFSLEEGDNIRVPAALEREIREAAWRLEDVLESLQVSNQYFLPQSQHLHGAERSYLEEEINLFTQKIEEQLNNTSAQPEEDESAVVSSGIVQFSEKKAKMVGLDDELRNVKKAIIHHKGPSEDSKRKIVSIVGMAGIGGDKELAKFAYTSLERKRYLIVVDDIWNTQVWDELEMYFPNNNNGSSVLMTTRLHEVAKYASSDAIIEKNFLTEEESWLLLRRKVFGEEHLCPHQLEDAGKKIAKKCEGLPLAINALAKHLSKAERKPEYWDRVAEKESSAIIGADEDATKALYLSYKHLPHHLKACFLYMGVFPLDFEIHTSKIINLWCAEGFLERNSHKSLENIARECLRSLIFKSVVLLREPSSSGTIKTCKVHSVFWHLCTREAEKDKFFHIMNSNANKIIGSQRRLCIHNNTLFGIKDVRNSMASVSNARSLLCTGPHHEYPVPKCMGFSLLRVLDALTVRFYEFPIEVVKLIKLRYLAFTYNGKLPASISNLRYLQYLIVRQCLRILSSEARQSYLPMEIWDMKELRHLQVMGRDLPDPTSNDAFLLNLSTLLGVSAHSCTYKVFERIPNLIKLGVQMELAPDVDEPLCCFELLASLHKLESLKWSVVNPNLQLLVPAASVPIFPPGLKKLTLSGLGFPWEYMSTIARLENLEVLKLQCYAFQGQVWNTKLSIFSKLRFLLIEDTDLEDWYVKSWFPSLERLILRHCYKLKEISKEIGDIVCLEMIELDDCNPSLVASTKHWADKIPARRKLQVCVKSSENDKKRKS